MGNTQSEEPPHTDADNDSHTADKFQWPENLFVESRDMSDVAFLIYSWGYVLDVLANEDGIISGFEDPITPTAVLKLIEDNKDKLLAKYPDDFKEESVFFKSLKNLEARAAAAGGDGNPLTLELYDYQFQTHELVYGICKDSINKRITVVFRGTENSMAFRTNWSANMDITKVPERTPELLKDGVSGDEIWFHKGFSEYLNKPTVISGDADTTKKEQIISALKGVLKKYPNYKVYLTGHSLGAALSSIMAYYLAIDNEIPAPVSCINFASPRVGDSHFLEAIWELEKQGRLRFARFVNENDFITVIPTVNYQHVGFQIRLYETRDPPVITYPKVNDSWWNRFGRTMQNSWPSAFNFGYDHSDYRERIERHQETLKYLDLNKLYNDRDMVGYDTQL